MLVKRFADYKATAAQWIMLLDVEFYPDTLDAARLLYGPVQERFADLLDLVETSAGLLEAIAAEPNPMRTQLLRIFRKYVSPKTSVEMLKRRRLIPELIATFGAEFRDLATVRGRFAGRPIPDDALAAVLLEYKDRGQKGYELTERFFVWFEEKFGKDYEIQGPLRAGRDVMLHEVLEGYNYRTPADILILRGTTPLLVGFARYDSDRGGAQEDDRTSGNADKIRLVTEYSHRSGIPLKLFFLNDGPGLLLGSMWDDYARLEDGGKGTVLVATLKMLEERFTATWFDS